MNIISFSLYGDSDKYIKGAVRNIALANEFYPDWICRFYLDFHSSECRAIMPILTQKGAQVVINDSSSSPIFPMAWRFEVADDPDVERFIVRDADSRIGEREAKAVDEWVMSGMAFSSLRDHPAHARPMNGGLWGASHWQNQTIRSMRSYLEEWMAKRMGDYKGHDPDQGFLNEMIWPWAKGNCLQHDSVCRNAYPGSLPFPTKRAWPRFVGEVWNIDRNGLDVPRDGDWQQIGKEE